MSNGVLLAIDTATRMPSIALYGAEGLLGEQTWRSGRNQSVEVLPSIDRLLALASVTRQELGAVAVAKGPGSFTGLRIGFSLAKGLCLALSLPIIAVPALEVSAYSAGDPGGPVVAIVEAGRRRIVVGVYAFADGLPQLQGELSLHATDAWTPPIDQPLLITGEVSPALAERLLSLPEGDALSLASPAGSVRRAGFLAELAWYRWQAGQVDDLDLLSPIYIQQPVSGTA
jgi:tRNA threonylcarbamoyladenosine biosynthesis protein TsaB